MRGICLKFYTYEFQKHHDILIYEWLLEFAKQNGFPGGTAFRAIAGYGRHGKLHEEHFFELASDVPIEVEFNLSETQLNHFLDLLEKENLDLFYTKSEIEYGSLKQTIT